GEVRARDSLRRGALLAGRVSNRSRLGSRRGHPRKASRPATVRNTCEWRCAPHALVGEVELTRRDLTRCQVREGGGCGVAGGRAAAPLLRSPHTMVANRARREAPATPHPPTDRSEALEQN